MKLFFLSLASLFLALPVAVQAVGVGVNPLSVAASLKVGQEVVKEIQVTNPSVEPGLFVVSADELADWFKFEPSELRLEARESRSVKVVVKPTKAGRYSVNLSVIGYPLDTRSFNAGSGLKVPVSLVVSGATPTPWWRYLGWGLLVVALAGGLGLGGWHFRHRHWWQRLRGW